MTSNILKIQAQGLQHNSLGRHSRQNPHSKISHGKEVHILWLSKLHKNDQTTKF